jgi:flagellar protein FliO/FliZ
MWEVLSWLFFIIFIAGLLVVGGLLLRGYLTTGAPTGGLGGTFFAPKPEKRLDVVEQTTVDGRRRLLLIRRDNVEHLIMTGGPVDVVIETGIGDNPSSRREVVDGPGAGFNRPARKLGQVAGENS